MPRQLPVGVIETLIRLEGLPSWQMAVYPWGSVPFSGQTEPKEGYSNGAFGRPGEAELLVRGAELPGIFPEEHASCSSGGETLTNDQLPPGRGKSGNTANFYFLAPLSAFGQRRSVITLGYKELTGIHPH